MLDSPDDLPLVERSAVRVVVQDRDGRVLLLRIREPQHEDGGSCWELPGGGIDASESYLDAAIRELFEETGLIVNARDVGSPTWHRRVTFLHAGTRRLQDEVVVGVHILASSPLIDRSHQVDDELDTCFDAQWWRVEDIEVSSERFFPGALPTLLPRFLAGEEIDEPFEHFT